MTKIRLSMRVSTLFNLIVAVISLASIATVVLSTHYFMRRQALAEAEAKMRLILDRNLALHAYFSQDLKPNLFEWSEPFRTPEYFDPGWMSSTYALRQIMGYFHEFNQHYYYYKDAALNARSPENEADEVERAFLEQLTLNPDLPAISEVQRIDGKPYLVVIRPGEVLEEECLRCHSDPAIAPQGLVSLYGSERSFHREAQVGQVISAISVRVPLEVAYAQADRLAWRMSALLAAFFSLLFLVQLWSHNALLFHPLARVRDMALQIVSDPHHLGEQIPAPAGRELSELTSAFNSMSLDLRQNMDTLHHEIDERKQAQQRTRTALDEKEMLLKEIHHRVKNNLTVISSLLNLQGNASQDERLQAAFQDSQGRIQAMIAVHEQLYRSDNLTQIDMTAYISRLSEDLHSAYDALQVELQVQVGDVHLNIDQAIPCGMILNELLTNAYKYAFPQGWEQAARPADPQPDSRSESRPRITVSLQRGAGVFVMKVSDNGVGVPNHSEPAAKRTLGMRLVKGLVSQLDGSLEIESMSGATACTVTFPEQAQSKLDDIRKSKATE